MRSAGRFAIGASVLRVLSAAGLALLPAACQPVGRLAERETSDAPIFAPTDLRVHPFTAVKDWTGDNQYDGVEVLLELQDRFRDPTKATGTALFELYDFRRFSPDPRGERLAAWRGTIQTVEEQRMRWNRISRTYGFQLAYPQVRRDRSYVLQVWFETGGRRLTSQVVLEGQQEKNVADDATTQPATRPATRPAQP